MSYNGSGTFVINSAGTPYVSGTVISSTAANALNNDLATGLTTALTKDGQTTPTANIPLGGFKITGLGAGTVASDAARLSQVQNSTTTTLIAITGTDTITGTVSPTLTAYATGQVFSFIVAATNTGAVTLNVDSIGVKAVTRTGAVALVAGDMVTGQIAVVEYDGTRFQLINGNSFTNLKASGTLGVTGVTTIAAGTALLPALTTTGDTNTGVWFPAADTIAASTGGTERVRVTSGGNVGIACTPARRLSVQYDFAKTDTTSRPIAVFKSNDASNANEMLISSTGAATQASRTWKIQTGEDGVSNTGVMALQPDGGSVTIGGVTVTTKINTVQVFTSGSGTYTLPADCKAIKVTMVGGGGGGGGGGTGAGGAAGGAGGNTTFGTNTANGGGGGLVVYGAPGAGGSVSAGLGTNLIAIAGGDASSPTTFTNGSGTYTTAGSQGGTSIICGSAGAGGSYLSSGGAGRANSGCGGGGGGGGNPGAVAYNGVGGGSGGGIICLIASPSATYAYGIGAAGTAGAAGTGGTNLNPSAGGAGGSGLIIVEEFYV